MHEFCEAVAVGKHFDGVHGGQIEFRVATLPVPRVVVMALLNVWWSLVRADDQAADESGLHFADGGDVADDWAGEADEVQVRKINVAAAEVEIGWFHEAR